VERSGRLDIMLPRTWWPMACRSWAGVLHTMGIEWQGSLVVYLLGVMVVNIKHNHWVLYAGALIYFWRADWGLDFVLGLVVCHAEISLKVR
jgi:hypothetical protein